MVFEVVQTLSLAGNPAGTNEDAFAAEPIGAVVFDGATPVNEPLLPGRSDAAWLAGFGARRLIAHLRQGDGPRAALRHALADAEHSFNGLKRRAPAERYELPCASMAFAVPFEGGLDLLWYGDCAAIVAPPGEAAEVVGIAFDQRAAEGASAARFHRETGLSPVLGLKRAEHLHLFRAGRAKVNVPGGTWLFGTEPSASEHVSRLHLAAPTGTLVLLATDGFLALASDYGLYDAGGLLAAAAGKGLQALGEELRAVENADPDALRHPRFKTSDDATAVLVRLT